MITSSTTVGEVRGDSRVGDYLPWYSSVDTDTTVAIVRDVLTRSGAGERDGIANWRRMRARLSAMAALGIPTEFHHYPGLPHGFGLGQGTVAEGWISQALDFWLAHR